MLETQETFHHLAMAFGGHSQYTDFTVGQALCGQANNSTPWPIKPGLIRNSLEEAVAFIVETWDLNYEQEEQARFEIERGFVCGVIDLYRYELLQDWAV